MFYTAFRAIASWLLHLFYKVEPPVDPHGGLSLPGPVIFVGNHPNGLVDPGLVFALAQRRVTFLAKAPLFKIPVLSLILKGLGALPVFRKKDDPTQTAKNSGTLEASADALVKGYAITIFPEGISHSLPQLQELKTGAARIAFMAQQRGVQVRVVPIGLTYSEKDLFRSTARVEVGAPLEVAKYLPAAGANEHEAARALTAAIDEALRAVTLNLDQWEDLPLLQTAERLYALKAHESAGDPDRLRRFARGMQVLRDEQPERFHRLKGQVLSLQRRLNLVKASERELRFSYAPAPVLWFAARNLLALLLTPVFLLGMVVFFVPYWVPLAMVRLTRPEEDTVATVKVLTLLVLAPAWAGLLTGLAWWQLGWPAGLGTLLGVLPLALFTRYFLERRTQALLDVRTFFVLGNRAWLKQRLLDEASAVATEIEAVASELKDRVAVAR